ncbi:hypothetical protein YC2023_098604 [Brassica napus]
MDSATISCTSFGVFCCPKLDRSPSRIVKHALFEQARKNMCSSRYNSLLLESFSQIVSYGKSFQRKGSTRSLALQQISSLKRLK